MTTLITLTLAALLFYSYTMSHRHATDMRAKTQRREGDMDQLIRLKWQQHLSVGALAILAVGTSFF